MQTNHRGHLLNASLLQMIVLNLQFLQGKARTLRKPSSGLYLNSNYYLLTTNYYLLTTNYSPCEPLKYILHLQQNKALQRSIILKDSSLC